jgi:hypothetical protein
LIILCLLGEHSNLLLIHLVFGFALFEAIILVLALAVEAFSLILSEVRRLISFASLHASQKDF